MILAHRYTASSTRFLDRDALLAVMTLTSNVPDISGLIHQQALVHSGNHLPALSTHENLYPADELAPSTNESLRRAGRFVPRNTPLSQRGLSIEEKVGGNEDKSSLHAIHDTRSHSQQESAGYLYRGICSNIQCRYEQNPLY